MVRQYWEAGGMGCLYLPVSSRKISGYRGVGSRIRDDGTYGFNDEFMYSDFFEKEDDPRPLHLGDACGHFIDYSRGPYKVEQQYA